MEERVILGKYKIIYDTVPTNNPSFRLSTNDDMQLSVFFIDNLM